MKQAVIFDLDGTLLDTVDSMAYTVNRVLTELKLLPQPADAFRYYAGDGAEMLVRRALSAAGGTEGQFEEAFQKYRQYFASSCNYQVQLYPGVEQLLSGLRERQVQCAVLSNKPHQATQKLVKQYFPENAFAVVQGHEAGIALKPDPAGALRVIAKMGVSVSDCLYLGDTNVDMQLGKNAGFFTLGALWGFRDREELVSSGADALLDTPPELIPYLEQ